MSSGYNETNLSDDAQDIHRALASFQEELEAVDYYNQRMDKATDADLRAVLEHNRNEEIEHASMLYEWLRRRMPEFDTQAKTFLFSQGSLTDKESGGEAAGQDAPPAGSGLGLGKLT